MSRPTRSSEWIDALGLEVLPGESGWFTTVHRSSLVVDDRGEPVAASSSIYYLLDAERPINLWHWLAGDDVHVLVDGGPVEYVILPPDGPAKKVVLGLDVDAGQVPLVAVPAGSYKALRLLDPEGYALMGSVVTPAWAPERVRIETPPVERLTAGREHADWLTDDLVEQLGREPG